MKKLSVLICSLTRRMHMLDRLLDRLGPQTNQDIEILIMSDDGEAPIGKKRNQLVEKSTGEYVCFVDDDDLISENYIAKIIEAVKTSPDCVGIHGIMTTDGGSPRHFKHSLQYRDWFELRGIFYRNPNHLNPIKREIVLKEKFPEVNHGEDSAFSHAILKHLSTEVNIDEPIYFYEVRSNKSL